MVSIVRADDESDVLDSLVTQLKEKRVKVIDRTEDGETSSQLYLRLKPDVIIMNLNMPNYNGHNDIEKIKQEYPLAKIVEVPAVLSKPYEIDKLTE